MALATAKSKKIEELAKQLQALMAEDFDVQPGNLKSFDDLETSSVAIGDEITRIPLETASKNRSLVSQATMLCPDCHRECLYQEPEPRVVQSRRGEVTSLEGNYYCRHCRRAFFPVSNLLGLEINKTIRPVVVRKMVCEFFNSGHNGSGLVKWVS